MLEIRPTRTAIFDFDGTLCPNHVFKILFCKKDCPELSEAELAALRKAVKGLRPQTMRNYRGSDPRSAEKWEASLKEAFTPAIVNSLFGPDLSKLREFLEELVDKGIAIFVASNNLTVLIKVLLDQARLPYTAIFGCSRLYYFREYRPLAYNKRDLLALTNLCEVIGLPDPIVFYVDDDTERLTVEGTTVSIAEGGLVAEIDHLRELLLKEKWPS